MKIPNEITQRHLAILGTTGSGKTATAKTAIVEPVLRAGGRAVIIDPTGAWWGLRLKANGTPSDFPIYIFGGDHGDMPLRAKDAVALAEAFGTTSDSAIFDTSLMTVSERTSFFTEFAGAIIRKNRGPLHMVIDECHLFMPQAGASVGGAVPAMLHAGNNLVSLGRSKGLRVTMISQRPAKLHKDSLTQAQALIALRVVAPQDRKAIAEWIAEQADPVKGKAITESLSGLKPGEGWVWVPVAGFLERICFPMPASYDSSRAPDESDGHGPELAPLNLDSLRGRLTALEAETKANDPKALKTEIARLKGEMSRISASSEAAPQGFTQEQLNKACSDAFAAGNEHGYARGARDVRDGLSAAIANAVNSYQTPKLQPVSPPTKYLPTAPERSGGHHKANGRSVAPKKAASPSYGLTLPQTKVIRSLLFWSSNGKETPTRAMVAGIAGYSPGSGNFNNILGGLKALGQIDYPAPGLVSVVNCSGYHDMIDADEARRILQGTLSMPQLKIIESILAGDSADLDRTTIAERSGYSAGSGNFNNLLGQLRSLGVIEYPAKGTVALADWAREVLS